MASDIEVKIKPNGAIQLVMMRTDAWGRVRERKSYTLSRRRFEQALASATLEAPWVDLLAKR